MPPANEEALFIGLISGTSRDGVDAALISFVNDKPDLLHALRKPYPFAIAKDLSEMLGTGEPPRPGIAAALDEQLARFFAQTARQLIAQAGVEGRDIRAIGSHGQTVWHQPGGERPRSIQLGKGALVARYSGMTTVADFRKADMRAGGQGAPLAPLLHRHLFQSTDERRAVLNLGGIANITLLNTDDSVQGFDCGPANCLMDAWIGKTNGADYDADGEWAAGGQVQLELLDRLLADPYFSQPPPKSTGLEYFNLRWLDSIAQGLETGEQDMQCTLAELTAMTVANALPRDEGPQRVLVCGGGVHNSYLMARIGAQLPGTTVESTIHHGADPDWVEAILFAWLAKERLAHKPQDTCAITGARHPILLGKIHYCAREKMSH